MEPLIFKQTEEELKKVRTELQFLLQQKTLSGESRRQFQQQLAKIENQLKHASRAE